MAEDTNFSLKEKIRALPSKSGVYLMRDRLGQIIYIGKAKSLKHRVSQYFAPNSKERKRNPKIAAMIDLIKDFDYIKTPSEADALRLESKLIKEKRPLYNTLERDDKRFLLLRVETFRELPRFTFDRNVKDDTSLYYGPYLDTKAIYSTINELQKKFGILSFDAKPIKVGDSKWKLYDDARAEIFETKNIVTTQEYHERVKLALEFLSDKEGEIVAQLEEKMIAASKNLEFEKAAKLRDAISAIEQTKKLRNIHIDPIRTSKEIAKRALAELKKTLGMKSEPLAMECFDISHISGTYTVASMVHFDAALPAKNKYRRFKLPVQNNDYASMFEVVSRRYKRLRDEQKPMPNLIVIDGGKGQVNMALKAFEELQIAHPKIVGLAEREETIVCEDLSEISLPRQNEALKLLQRIRDEAHRFANDYRKTLQRKKIKESILDDFEGFGKKRKDALLAHFGSIAKVKQASAEELAEVEGIGKQTAQKLREFLDRISTSILE